MNTPFFSSFERLLKKPLDSSSVFESISDLNVYLNESNSSAYDGQIVFVKNESRLFVIDNGELNELFFEKLSKFSVTNSKVLDQDLETAEEDVKIFDEDISLKSKDDSFFFSIFGQILANEDEDPIGKLKLIISKKDSEDEIVFELSTPSEILIGLSGEKKMEIPEGEYSVNLYLENGLAPKNSSIGFSIKEI